MFATHRAAAPTPAARTGLINQAAHFGLHFAEMCMPMCVGFALGDAVYFWLASLAGYSRPFRELPELSVVLVTVFMTAPMVAWMLYRAMPRRATAEMAAVMPIMALGLLALGWMGALPRDSLALLEHGLMMPAMLIPMLWRLDLYTGRAPHANAAKAGTLGPSDRPHGTSRGRRGCGIHGAPTAASPGAVRSC